MYELDDYENDDCALPRNPRSFFIYLLDNGLSVDQYTEAVDQTFHEYPVYSSNHTHKLAAYRYIWPYHWAAYVAICRITGTEPH